jgi:hypothetical protein
VSRYELDFLWLLHEEDQRNDGQRDEADEPEQVVEGEDLRLLGDLEGDERGCLGRVRSEAVLAEIDRKIAIVRRRCRTPR